MPHGTTRDKNQAFNEKGTLSNKLVLLVLGETMLESKYQAILIKKLQDRYKDCIILKNDPNIRQGIPDLLILWDDKWAALEVKNSFHAPYRPNQEYYLEKMDAMSFAMMICPENEELVLRELTSYFFTQF